ncbi:sensor histidine kinase, partial [Nodularia sphaerocarpa]
DVECNLPEIIQEVSSELTPLASEKNLALKIDTSKLDLQEESAGVVMGDPLELRRVFNNLIGNAIKFTDTGGIEVCIWEKSANSQGKDSVIIELTDTGYGIAPEDQSTVFERFRQGRNKRSGSGLGLHLSSRIIEAHGGTITLTSEVGRGSVFTVTLPKFSSH